MSISFKPFYWLDISKTEKWLSRLSSEGKQLSGMNFLFGIFSFSEGNSEEKTYLIRRSPGCEGNIPQKMREDGWKSVCGSKNNYAACYDGKNDLTPSCKGYRLRSSILKTICALVVCYAVGFLGGAAASYFDRRSLPEDSERYIASFSDFFKRAYAEYLIHFLLIAAGAAGIAATVRSGHIYDSMSGIEDAIDFTIPRENFLYTRKEEKRMIKEKKLIAKNKPAWFYSPDKAEKYVEDMEAEGWNFYRFDKMGKTFYFLKGEKRKVRFVVDYQNYISDEYLQSNIECGWKLQFKSHSKITGYVIWLKEYEGDEPPEFYSDGESMLNYARRTALTYLCCFLPCIALMVYLLFDIFLSGREPDNFDYFIIGLYGAVICEYIIFLWLSLSFYFRVRKKYSNNNKG